MPVRYLNNLFLSILMWPFGALKVKKDIQYEMTVDDADGSYSLSMDFDLPKSWYLKAIASLPLRAAGKDVKLVDAWEVEEQKFKDVVLGRMKGTVDKVQKDFGKDFSEFKITHTKVNKIQFRKSGDRVHTHLELEGVCVCRK